MEERLLDKYLAIHVMNIGRQRVEEEKKKHETVRWRLAEIWEKGGGERERERESERDRKRESVREREGEMDRERERKGQR